jgi:hypothetical protein
MILETGVITLIGKAGNRNQGPVIEAGPSMLLPM